MIRFAFLASALLIANTASGEELLVKANGSYLGNRQANGTQFKICNGGMIAIAPGMVTPTDEKCPKRFVMGPVTVKSVDGTGMITVTDEKGTSIEFRLTATEQRETAGALLNGGRLVVKVEEGPAGRGGSTVKRTFSVE